MARWSGPEILSALDATAGQLPVSAWLHLALADVCRALGYTASRAELCARWGFEVPKRDMTDDELIDWAKKWQT